MQHSSRLLASAIVAAMALLPIAQAQAAVIPGLFNTGTDASNVALVGGNGVTDSHYQIVASTNPAFIGQQAVTYHNPSYRLDDADSRWISSTATGGPSPGASTYRLVFDLTGLDPTTAQITGVFDADNFAAILLNGVATGDTVAGFALVNFTLNRGFVAGLNTLDFALTDFLPPTALWVDDLAGTADLAGAIPEPGSWAMMLLGFFGLGSVLRNRRRKAIRFAGVARLNR